MTLFDRKLPTDITTPPEASGDVQGYVYSSDVNNIQKLEAYKKKYGDITAQPLPVEDKEVTMPSGQTTRIKTVTIPNEYLTKPNV